MGGAAEDGLRVVFLGPPGSGKGTQAAVLSQKLGVPAISTGEMLREAVAAASDLGRKVQAIMAEGRLVDDETMAEVVREKLSQCERGFLLDGYPRTVPQAETLGRILAGESCSLDAVVLIDVPEDELVRRMVARKRSDDGEEVVRERLRIYREKTAPLIGYYEQRGLLRRIAGDRSIEDVTRQMASVLGIR